MGSNPEDNSLPQSWERFESEKARWVRVVPAASLPRPGSLCKATVEGREIFLARLEDGTVAAGNAACPHEAADLSEGTVYMGAVDCPRHHYLYDLRTGENRYPRNVFPTDLAAGLKPLRLYPVKDEDGAIWIRITQA